MNQKMAKYNYFIGKRSEYRQNYLPFDYYDFMITAKENENLRFRNKIRDYLHTPFDWDEDQDFYLEEESKFKHASQATQTSERPRHGPNKQNPLHDNYKDKKADHHHQHHHHHNHQHQQHQHQQQQYQELQQEKQQQQQHVQCFSHDDQKQKPKIGKKAQQTERKNSTDNNNSSNGRLVKSASVQINIDGNKEKRPKSVKKRNVNKNNINNKSTNNDLTSSSATNLRKVDFRSISSMAVQTPLAWNLRDYNIAKSKSAKSMPRSASVAVSQPKRAPFVNYGWATKTKDLSIKPTHNALANKILADQNDRDALVELTLHKLKKDATLIANEYSAVESEAAEHFHTGRSDSRAWNSEYDDKYPDYSSSALKKELYFTQNPNRLSKSTLVLNNPQLRRGPKSAKAKIFYNEH